MHPLDSHESHERRQDGRLPTGVLTLGTGSRIFANKYIDGIPHLVEVLDASSSGVQVRRILEPEHAGDTFSVELLLGGVSIWAWMKRVWTRGDREALRIVSADPIARARLRKLVRDTLAA